jgi:glycosyltransferase involved in cell wall biosynthesis
MSGKDRIAFDVERSFGNLSPSLVFISNGSSFPPVELVEMCVARGWPFATVDHAQNASLWPSDETAARLRNMLPLARRLFFVSETNRILAEKQFGYAFDNAEIIRNPIAVAIDAPVPWPSSAIEHGLNMACVGRLHAGIKGQDILLEALANTRWIGRNWRLTLYGNGPNRDLLERLAKRLELQNRVSFAGYVAVEKIWPENHVLVMPSRSECLPLAIVEAMFCGRPVVATNVGGVAEVVEDGRTGFLAEAAVVKSFDETLEQMWLQRDRLQEIGKLAAASIREFLGDDPVRIFAEKLKRLANLSAPN